MKVVGTLRRVLSKSALVAAKRAELASIDGVAMPKLYFAIGKKLALLQKLPADLEPLRVRIAALREPATRTVEASLVAEITGQGGWFRRYVRRAGQVAVDAGVSAKVTAGYVQLGQLAVSTYGDKAVPKERQDEWVELMARRTAIVAAIADLESHNGYGWLTVSRIAIAGLVGIPVLTVFLLLLWMGYPFLVMYALLRAAVLIAVVITVYRLCVALVAYVRKFTTSMSGHGQAAEWQRLKRRAAYAAVGILAVYALPIPTAPRASDAPHAASNATATPRRSGALPSGRAVASPTDAGANMSADMFMNLVFQAAAMDQLARQTMPRLQPTYVPSSPQPGIRGLQPIVPYGGNQSGVANMRGGQPRQMQQWEGVCSRCGYRTGRQVTRGNSREKCIQFAGQGQMCGGVLIWQPAEGF